MSMLQIRTQAATVNEISNTLIDYRQKTRVRFSHLIKMITTFASGTIGHKISGYMWNETKSKIYKATVRPIITYALEILAET